MLSAPSDTRTAAMLAAFILSACGGGDSRRPSPVTPSTPDPSIPAGTVLSVVSGETGDPVAGATVVVHGRTYTTAAGGTVSLAERVEPGALVDVVSDGALDRQTLFRSAAGARFSLWPRQSASGLDENYTATLVYTRTGDPPPPIGSAALLRPSGSQVAVVLSADLLADPSAVEAHERAVADITSANGSVSYTIASSRPSGGIVFEARVDPSVERCASGTVRAFTTSRQAGMQITGGEIVYCRADVARSATVGHELGHTLGLSHSPDSSELMFFQFARGRAPRFGPRESLVMRLLLQRPAGNRYPDNDRSAPAGQASGEVVSICK